MSALNDQSRTIGVLNNEQIPDWLKTDVVEVLKHRASLLRQYALSSNGKKLRVLYVVGGVDTLPKELAAYCITFDNFISYLEQYREKYNPSYCFVVVKIDPVKPIILGFWRSLYLTIQNLLGKQQRYRRAPNGGLCTWTDTYVSPSLLLKDKSVPECTHFITHQSWRHLGGNEWSNMRDRELPSGTVNTTKQLLEIIRSKK